MKRRFRRCRDAWPTLLLSATLGLLLYAQRDGAAPKTRAPPARGQSPRPTPGLRARAPPNTASAALLAYEDDTPVPPTPTGPFDFGRYLRAKDQRRFPLLINQPRKCRRDGASGGPPDLLIAVKSVAADFERREAVRQTWGAEGRVQGALVRRVFLLGVPRGAGSGSAGTRTHWRALLETESRAYADILLWDFEDTFFNLTLKEIHFLAWATAFCPDVRFVFKGDADVFVHVRNLLQFLESRDPAQDGAARSRLLPRTAHTPGARDPSSARRGLYPESRDHLRPLPPESSSVESRSTPDPPGPVRPDSRGTDLPASPRSAGLGDTSVTKPPVCFAPPPCRDL